MIPRPTLIVLAKAPRLGRVKRRLARGLGPALALGFYRACLRATLRRLGREARWHRIFAVAPDRLRNDPGVRRLARSWQRVAQGRGDLGARMLRQLAGVRGPAVLIGGDIPDIVPADIAAALRRLRRADAVFGPSEDGGYWLIGTARPPRRGDLLAGVRWSTPHALADSVTALESRAGWRIALAGPRADVDDVAAYRRWRHGRRESRHTTTLPAG